MGEGVELRWPGKYVDGQRAALTDHGAELVVREQLGEDSDGSNRVICGDNLLALEALVRAAPASVDLVYIDPPFATGNRFALSRRVGDKQTGTQADLRLPAFDDAWTGGAAGFLRMLDPRLRLIHKLLAPTGSLYVHVDPTVGHAVKLMLDEVFGPGCFQREIVWRIGWISGFKTRARNWIRNHDSIFFYTKHPREFVFNKMWVPHPKGYVRREGRAAKAPGVAIDDVWNAGTGELELSGRESLDSIQIKSFSREKTGWATQKNESLLRRIIAASSEPGALVADLFAGSGTTASVAHELGRRFMICDHADAAVQICRQRLLAAGASFALVELDACERARALADLAETCGSAEAGAATLRTWMLEQLGADPEQAGALERPFAGRRGAVGLALGLPGERVDAARIETLRAAARAQGVASVELLAFDWDGPAPVELGSARAVEGEDPPVVPVVVGRGVFDAAARAVAWVEGGVAVWERPRLVVERFEPPGRQRGGSGTSPTSPGTPTPTPIATIGVRLVDVQLHRPEHLPEALRAVVDSSGVLSAWLLGWAVFDADAPTRPLFVAARRTTAEPLALEAGVPACARLLIACEDVCGHRHLWTWAPEPTPAARG